MDNFSVETREIDTVGHVFRRLALAATLACALAVTAGCAPEPEPTPSSTALFSSKQEAFAAAEKTYRAYVDALNKVDLSNPATFQDVYKWETGDREAGDKKTLTNYHAHGVSMSGSTKVSLLEPSDVASDWSTVTLAACVDVSAVQIRDSDGVSLVSSNRPDVQRVSVELTANPGPGSGFLVASVSGRSKGPRC